MGTIYRIRFPKNPKRFLKKKGKKFNHFPVNDYDFILSEASFQILKTEKGTFSLIQKWDSSEHGIQPYFSQETLLEDPPPQEVIEEVIAAAMAKKLKDEHVSPMYRGRCPDKISNAFFIDRPGGRRRYWWSWEKNPESSRPLKDHFQNIIAKATDPDTRFVLSLGAGGLRLFAHATMMKIIDSLDLKKEVDEIWGCSGGSIAGLFYSLGIDPEVIEKEGYDIYNKKYQLSLHPSKRELIKNAITNLVLPSNPFALKGLMNIQQGLKQIMTRVVEEGEQNPEIPFFAIAYNLHKKINQVLTPMDIDTQPYQGLVQKVSPLDSVLASSSIPLLYVPKVIRVQGASQIYVDGGAAEEVPLLSLHRKWRIDQKKGLTDKKKMFVLAVNLFPEVSHLKVFRHKFFKKLPFMDIIKWGSHLADLIRQARIEDHMHILKDDPSVQVKQIILTYPAPGVLVPTSIPNMIARARQSFFKQLLKINGELE